VSFHIEWQPATLRQFADEWDQLDQARQREVMDGLDDTDQLLQTKPMLVGESRDVESKRILIHTPLSIVYRVDLRLQRVTIVGARILGKCD